MKLTEIRYQPEKSQIYLGSPSIVRAPDNALIAYHDYFGKLDNHKVCLSEIYRSEDEGETWENVYHVIGAFWGALFATEDAVYLISCYAAHHMVVLRKSVDGGYTWTTPDSSENGLLFPDAQWDTSAPVQILNGRVYRDVEPTVPYFCPAEFYASVISAPLDSNLLNSQNWTVSNKLRFDAMEMKKYHPELVPGDDLKNYGWLEGNVLEKPDGSGLCNLMRIHLGVGNKAAFLELSPDGKTLSFDYENGIIDFPGGSSKFTIRRDPVTKRYFALSNPVPCDQHLWCRNQLVASWSDDLRHWHTFHTVLRDDSGLNKEDSIRLTGFQYPDWQIDGDDMICAVRTAYRGANTFHNSNRITFHRIKDFRKKANSSL